MNEITNPILPGFNPDPSLCRGKDENGNAVYYIANSTFEWFPGVQIHRSYDLINWELVARPLDSLELLDMRGDPDSGGIWAPDLSFADGLYWLVYTDVKVTEGAYKDCANYLTTAPSIFGPWSAPVHLTNSGFDASLFHDRDGKKYLINMFWDVREYQHPFAGIQCAEYSPTQKKLLTETAKIIYRGTNVKLVEGPHLYRLQTPKNEFYYLFAAQGGTVYTHQEIVARVPVSAGLTGEFTTQPGGFEGEPFLTAYDKPFNYLQKCGHGALCEVGGGVSNNIAQNQWYFAHLVGRPLKIATTSEIDPRGYCPLGRETAIQKVEWDNDGWPHIVGGKQGAAKISAPNLSAPAPERIPSAQTNTRYQLPFDFQTLRIPFSEKIGKYTPPAKVNSDYSRGGAAAASVNGQSSDRENFGELTLFGRESLLSLFTQAHVARRWQAFNFDAEVFVEFSPVSYQQQAGITAYYNTRHWVMLHITNAGSGMDADKNNRRVLEITQTDRGQQTSILGASGNLIELGTIARIGLRLQVCENYFSFAYSLDDGISWKTLPKQFQSIALSDDYTLQTYGGFFTGAFVGLAAIDGSGGGLPAKFSGFKYVEK